MFIIINSTSDSIQNYQCSSEIEDIKVGKTILLQNPKTKHIKKFKVEYKKGDSENLILKNSNITIHLKRRI